MVESKFPVSSRYTLVHHTGWPPSSTSKRKIILLHSWHSFDFSISSGLNFFALHRMVVEREKNEKEAKDLILDVQFDHSGERWLWDGIFLGSYIPNPGIFGIFFPKQSQIKIPGIFFESQNPKLFPVKDWRSSIYPNKKATSDSGTRFATASADRHIRVS